ncbi:hypothetical protein J2S64_000179 [Paeniglutamicibacter sulfureus]|uniref:Uncharacterized protein n=1 Tax=Paeniglutamicibacter sulfureus TaxID=43666 RepID=A0ABU2BFG0_9MICC|nr:hypothetical protein [Paeniglutamicibacter sulfureus]
MKQLLKWKVSEAINGRLAAIRSWRNASVQDRGSVHTILKDGNERANAFAEATLVYTETHQVVSNVRCGGWPRCSLVETAGLRLLDMLLPFRPTPFVCPPTTPFRDRKRGGYE